MLTPSPTSRSRDEEVKTLNLSSNVGVADSASICDRILLRLSSLGNCRGRWGGG